MEQFLSNLSKKWPKIPAGPVVLWKDDFDGYLKFELAIDKSVGCPPPYSPTMNDIGYKIVQDPTSPSEEKTVLELIANPDKELGHYVNIAASRNIYPDYDNFGIKDAYRIYPDRGRGIYRIYIFSGYWKKLEKNLDRGEQPESIGINLSRVVNGVEHFAEVRIPLNPSHPDYGWLTTRGEGFKVVRLAYVGDDSNWHRFEIEVE